MTAAFPAGFEWGTATAAHQIEGANWNNDWWLWEHTPSSGCIEPSGDACDSWHRWDEDVRLCDELGMGGYRFSLEWSRIEPEEGEWSRAALECSGTGGSGEAGSGVAGSGEDRWEVGTVPAAPPRGAISPRPRERF